MNIPTPVVITQTKPTKNEGNTQKKTPAEILGVSNTLKIVAYARASPGSPNPAPQLEEIKAWANTYNHQVVAELVDDQASGKDFERDAWREAKQAVLQADAIVCTKLDRFGRSVRHIHDELGWLKEHGRGLITIDGVINTVKRAGGLGGAVQDLTLNIFAAIAEFERAMILDRTQAGKDRARKAGVVFGRKPVVKDDEQVVALHKQGWSQTRLAKKFGVSRAAVHSSLLRSKVI